MPNPSLPDTIMPKVTRLRDHIYMLDFRHVTMMRTDALIAARNMIDSEVPPGTQIGTLMDYRHMTQYSFSADLLKKHQWNHDVIRSAWLIVEADAHISERARKSFHLPYPVGLFFDRDEAIQWLTSAPDTPPRF